MNNLDRNGLLDLEGLTEEITSEVIHPIEWTDNNERTQVAPSMSDPFELEDW
jgi:hypothetical protein